MKILKLKETQHGVTVGDTCVHIEPNVLEDSLFVVEDKPIGFYIKDIAKYSKKAAQLADIADVELRSKRVPKSVMKRSSGFLDNDKSKQVLQYSTILGSIPPKPHMRRPYPTRSSVHSVQTAKTFIKAMLLLAKESEKIIKELTPELYAEQKEIIAKNIAKEWRFSDLFTSSISNFNIAADFHRDNGNLKGCSNVIITKRSNSTGGCTTVPDYGATVDSRDNSMLYYPAWRNIHGVTPIVPTHDGGYRNSLVFYPLSNFPKE
ncbi:MAG: hypothetical protein HN775_08550 [Hellea sp.]|jgi:hypothetical protein|nr:hypothetical protein [Hellea sp.]